MINVIKRFCLIALLFLIPLFAYSARLTPLFVRSPQQSVEDFLRFTAPQGSELTNFSYSMLQIQGQEMLIGIYWRAAGFNIDGNLLTAKDNKVHAYLQYAFAFIPKNDSPTQYVRAPIIGFSDEYDDYGVLREVLAIFTASFAIKSEPNLAFLTRWDTTDLLEPIDEKNNGFHYDVLTVNFHPPFTFTQLNSPTIAELGGCDACDYTQTAKASNVAEIKKQLVSLGIPQPAHSAIMPPTDSYSIFSIFTRNPQQSIYDFLTYAAPQDSKLTNFSHAMMQIQGQQMLIGVYERLGEESNSGGYNGGFSDTGNILPPNATDGYRQYAFAFIQKKNSSTQYVRVPVMSFLDDGGSPRDVVAIFKASFAVKSEPKLAFLTTWDSSSTGARSVMDSTGIQYDVFAANLQPSLTFTQLDTPTIDKLGGCDCTATDPNDTAANETAKARNVKEIKQQLVSMEIPQQTE